MNKDLLMIFVKNLVPGEVKTRLAAEVGIYEALHIYEALVEHTREVAEEVAINRMVLYSTYLETGDFFSDDLFKRTVQRGESLGDRMLNAFKNAFEAGYNRVVLIGSDCPSLSAIHLKNAFQSLDQHDLAVGPAQDGGYYLIGMKKLHITLFQNKDYSHDRVMDELLSAARDQNLTIALLEELNDIDTLADLKNSGFEPD